MNFEVRRKAEPALLIATGKYVLVSVRKGDFVKVPVPDELRQRLAPYLAGPPHQTAR